MGLLDFFGRAKAAEPADEGAALEHARDLARAELSAAADAEAAAVASLAAAREAAERSESAAPSYVRAQLARESAAARVKDAEAVLADAETKLATFVAKRDALARDKEETERTQSLQRTASREGLLADTAGAREDMVKHWRGLIAAMATMGTAVNTANDAVAELRARGEFVQPFARHAVVLPLLEFIASEEFDTAESIAGALEDHRITALVPQRGDGSVDVSRIAAVFGFEFRKRAATSHAVQRVWRWLRARNNVEALATMNAAEANAAE